MMKESAGYTLIELATVIALLFVLAAIALPAWSGAREAAALRLAATSFSEDLRRAFVHAILRSERVVLCPRATGQEARCAGEPSFERGWIVFVDADGDRERATGEALLIERAPPRGDFRIRSSEGRPRVVIQPDGGNRGTNLTLVFCGRHGMRSAQAVVLSNDGRVRLARPNAGQVTARCT